MRGALLILVFVSVFFYIFSLNFRTPDRMDGLQRSVVETVSPPVQFFGKVFSSIEDFIKGYIWLRNIRGENETLKKEVSELEQRVTNYQEAYVENLRLRRQLDFKSSVTIETMAAQVTMHDLTGWFQTLMVDKGFRDGISPDMPVVNDEGVVGRVLDVSDRHSRVLLITDPGSSVDCVIQRNRVRGVLAGKDANGCILKYIRANVDVQAGDLIITSGKDGIFPKGLRLGVIQGVFKDPVDLFQKIEVKPLVRLTAVEEVLLLKHGAIMPDLEGDEAEKGQQQEAPQQPAQINQQLQKAREQSIQPQTKPRPPVKPRPGKLQDRQKPKPGAVEKQKNQSKPQSATKPPQPKPQQQPKPGDTKPDAR